MDSIYTDFSKAFNRVRHCLLLDKMSSDIEPAARCQWLRSHFFGPAQKNVFQCFDRYYCYFERSTGQPFRATLLHVVYEWNLWVRMSAFDMMLFLLIRGFQDCIKFQSYLNRLVDWCAANSLKLIVVKCKSITFLRLSHHVGISYS
jgi:hypothetical protein